MRFIWKYILSTEKKLNTEEVLIYPLRPIPLRSWHNDGKMSKATKSTVIKELEKLSVLNSSDMVDVVIFEGMFFHLLSDLPETFEFQLFTRLPQRSDISASLIQILTLPSLFGKQPTECRAYLRASCK